jgi:hypothetical protein
LSARLPPQGIYSRNRVESVTQTRAQQAENGANWAQETHPPAARFRASVDVRKKQGGRPRTGSSELPARIAAVGPQMLALSYACQASPLLTVQPLIRGADSMPKVGMKLPPAPAHTHHQLTPPASCPKPIGPLPASSPPALAAIHSSPADLRFAQALARSC